MKKTEKKEKNSKMDHIIKNVSKAIQIYIDSTQTKKKKLNSNQNGESYSCRKSDFFFQKHDFNTFVYTQYTGSKNHNIQNINKGKGKPYK
jgi:hypothetical protein